MVDLFSFCFQVKNFYYHFYFFDYFDCFDFWNHDESCFFYFFLENDVDLFFDNFHSDFLIDYLIVNVNISFYCCDDNDLLMSFDCHLCFYFEFYFWFYFCFLIFLFESFFEDFLSFHDYFYRLRYFDDLYSRQKSDLSASYSKNCFPLSFF